MKDVLRQTLMKKLKVSVTSFEDRWDVDPVTGEKSAEYTVYAIQVENSLNGSKWALTKRYSDFSKLYNDLRSENPEKFADYKFPNKSLFNTFSQFTKLRRQEGFDQLLQRALSLKMINDEMYAFLEIGKHTEPNKQDSAQVAEADSEVATVEPGSSDAQRDIAISSSGIYLSVADEELANERLRLELASILKSSGMLVLVLYAISVYAGSIDLLGTSSARVVMTYFSLTFTITLLRAVLRKRDLLVDIVVEKKLY